MGPFDSEKVKGTFNKDISKVRQNDVWSSATINNFVETVYNLFRMESAYRLTYKNSGQEIGEQLLKENPDTNGSSTCNAFALVPDLHFSVRPGDGSQPGYIKITPAQRPKPTDDATNFDPDADSDDETRYRLFYGTGDVSLSVKPYSMFHYPRASAGVIADSSMSGTAVNNYCIITYQCGIGAATSKYSRMVEMVCLYDPGISGDDSTITTERATDMPKVLPPVKFTFTFGKAVTVRDFVDRLNGLVYGQDVSEHIFNARLVGDTGEANTITLREALFGEDGETRQAQVLRFVPVRSCISFEPDDSEDSEARISASLTELTSRADTPDNISITEYDGTWEEGNAVFRHTGTYGFIVENKIDKAPCMEYAATLPFVYVPNKVNYQHYEPPVDGSSAAAPLPVWYAGMVSKNITVADTADFSSDYFFVPYITITDRTIEIAGFVIDIDILLTYGEITAAVTPGSYSVPLKESKVIYDFSEGKVDACLKEASMRVYGKMARAIPKWYSSPDSPELSPLNAQTPWVSSLARTLQFMTGLTWQLSDTVWIDPALGESSAPELKMFGSLRSVYLCEDTTGEGSLFHPGAVVVYLSREGVPGQEHVVSRPPVSGVRHISLVLPSGTAAVSSPYFSLTGAETGDLELFIGEDAASDGMVAFIDNDFSKCRSIRFYSDPDVPPDGSLVLSGGVYPGLEIAPSLGRAVELILKSGVKVTRVEGGGHISVAAAEIGDVSGVYADIEFRGAVFESVRSRLLTLRGCRDCDLDLSLLFYDRREEDPYSGMGGEVRDLSEIPAFVQVEGTLENCRITFRIKDYGNTGDWTAPDGTTVYEPYEWQAFDPDIFLPRGRDNTSSLPDYFPFINCGLYSADGQGRFINCDVTVDLSDDFVRDEPEQITSLSPMVPNSPRKFVSRKDCQFFASRIFRKSPYIFYLGDRHPYYYGIGDATDPLACPVHRSEGVRLNFITKAATMAVRADFSDTVADGISPSLPVLDGLASFDYTFTKSGCRAFLSGLKGGMINVPSVFMPVVIKHSRELTGGSSARTYQLDSYAGGSATALFESVAGCDIRVGRLNTSYPLQDEWDYATADYDADDTVVYWAEPGNGFQLFTYPKNWAHDRSNIPRYADKRVNMNDKLYIAEWRTRQNLSGIYGLYDSEVMINYSYTTQGKDLGYSQDSFSIDSETGRITGSGLRGRVRWDMTLADPGGIKYLDCGSVIPGIESSHAYTFYLPVLPLFYLAEVYSSNIRLSMLPGSGTSPLGGTRPDPNDIRLQYQTNTVPDMAEGRQTLIDGTAETTSYFNLQRSLRLAVGFVLSPMVPGSSVNLLAPSSYNTIDAHITRANLVSGVMNKISGWCYRLVSTRAFDFTPERYHYSGSWDWSDMLDPMPALTGNWSGSIQDLQNTMSPARYPSSGNPSDPDFKVAGILDPSLRYVDPDNPNKGLYGTVKVGVVTKELSFDCTAPGITVYEPQRILSILSFLHADYPVLGQTGVWDPAANRTVSGGNPNAVVNSASREWGASGYDLLIPGYFGLMNNPTDFDSRTIQGAAMNPDGAEEGFAGRLTEPSTLSWQLSDGQPSLTEEYWTQQATRKFDQRTPVVNALNTAELHVIQIATSEIRYINIWEVPPRSNLFGQAVFKNWVIGRGGILHTVLAQGWHILSNTGLVEMSFPEASGAFQESIVEGLEAGTITYDNGDFVFSQEWLDANLQSLSAPDLTVVSTWESAGQWSSVAGGSVVFTPVSQNS